MALVRIAAVIPARMGSSRFPGKPLVSIRGLPMVEHVRRRAVLSGAFNQVVVATCDEEIRRAVERYGGAVIMTLPTHPASIDRVVEATTRLDCTHVVNLQGDEPLVMPEDLRRMIDAIRVRPEGPAWNAVSRPANRLELGDRNVVKCVVSNSGRILFCSRDFSSLPFADNSFEPIRIILGITAYDRGFIARYGSRERTPLEKLESVDQSRIIEYDEPLLSVEFSGAYPSVNLPGDVDRVESCLLENELQRAALERVQAL